MLEILNFLSKQLIKKSFASSLELNLLFNSALKFSFDWDIKLAVVLNDDSGIKLLISFSLSTTNFTATDCTLPAESPLFIFLHRNGDFSNPNNVTNTIQRMTKAFF